MAEGDGVVYNNFKEQVLNGLFNLANAADVIQTILVTGHVVDIDGDAGYADVSADEYGAGLGYTVGGEVLAGQSTAQDNANDRGVFDGTDETWAALGPLVPATPSHAIMYDQTAAGDPLMAAWELGTTATNGGNYTLTWHADGILYIG